MLENNKLSKYCFYPRSLVNNILEYYDLRIMVHYYTSNLINNNEYS